MSNLRVFDFSIIVAYLIAMIILGICFSRKNKNPDQFTKASGKIPSWAVGLSLYATFLSSNTFLGVPGKAFGSNWNFFVLSLSLPLAALVASKYFIPFYRRSGSISAYSHLEHRFGLWARTYAVVCFLLTQLARMGSIFFGIGITIHALTGYEVSTIMIVMGVCIIFYTVLGGMEAVIWTEVAQAFIKTSGAFIILYIIASQMPGGISRIVEIGQHDLKFSLGSMSPRFTESTFWVVLLYGFCINLNNYGIDQNYVQRYHTATSARQASKALWLSVWMYVGVSLLFFIIGTSLYANYQANPSLDHALRLQVAKDILPDSASAVEIARAAANLSAADYGDKVLPHFMVNKIPTGLLGIIIAALLSASMSTISSGMNASATVFSVDIYKRYFKPELSDRQNLKVLYVSTVIIGLLGLAAGIAFIGVKSLLDMWWQLAGIFAGGVLGLFLLGIATRNTKNTEALIATIIGVLVVVWMSFSKSLPEQYAYLRSPFDTNMVIVIGTLALFLSGVFITSIKRKLTDV
ncbi:MAG TPA: sodium:solute symporter [Acidobacteriota bacterium]